MLDALRMKDGVELAVELDVELDMEVEFVMSSSKEAMRAPFAEP